MIRFFILDLTDLICPASLYHSAHRRDPTKTSAGLRATLSPVIPPPMIVSSLRINDLSNVFVMRSKLDLPIASRGRHPSQRSVFSHCNVACIPSSWIFTQSGKVSNP
ncbi:hypothetical protein PsorP6_009834 [Peronosclerospora sorghi]|uniref:Uncharacterized protein n=1 Tax=Peronosclerospora sorghi TaxID=230839 RepID=A0ACC0VYS5_9STRA|nr:hypothetical protein PsorP6_009834 [Peronosclerospora sorghi]